MNQNVTFSALKLKEILGLNNKDAYHLISSKKFKSYDLKGHKRVDVVSFENWYKHQIKYKKVNGEPPGTELNDTFSILEASQLFGCSEHFLRVAYRNNKLDGIRIDKKLYFSKDSLINLFNREINLNTNLVNIESHPNVLTKREIENLLGISKGIRSKIINDNNIKVVIINNKEFIDKNSFDEWFKNQKRYKISNYCKGNRIKTKYMTRKEIKCIFNFSDKGLRGLLAKKLFKIIYVNGEILIDRKSFEKWYTNQSFYKKHNYNQIGSNISKKISVKEMALLLGISTWSVRNIIKEYDFDIETINGAYYINYESFEKWCLSQNKYTIKEGVKDKDEI